MSADRRKAGVAMQVLEDNPGLALLPCHLDLVTHAEQLIDRHRPLLQIDPQWRIILTVAPSDVPYAGRMVWNAETWWAEMTLHPGLTASLEWTVVHELLELAWYQTGNLLVTLTEVRQNDPQSRLALRLFKIARNQEIEKVVATYLGCQRPLDLTERAA
jgi:hypothetical protein